MKLQFAGDLMTAIARVPKGYYVQFEIEKSDEEDGHLFWSAGLYQRAPEDGWPSRGARFGHPAESPTHQQSAMPYEHDDRILFGVTCDIDKPEVLERLMIAALTKEFP